MAKIIYIDQRERQLGIDLFFNQLLGSRIAMGEEMKPQFHTLTIF